MKAFEDDFIDLISNIKFRKINDEFLNNIGKDMKTVASSNNVLIFADKTRNIYKSSPETYHKLLSENITKSYETGDEGLASEINSELKNISCNLGIDDRIDIMPEKLAFITLKDYTSIPIRNAALLIRRRVSVARSAKLFWTTSTTD